MSSSKQGVNLDFVFGPDLEQQTTVNAASIGKGEVSSLAISKSNAYHQSDKAYSMHCVSIVILCIIIFNMSAAVLILNNLVINQQATYRKFITSPEMLLHLPSNRAITEFVMFESLVGAWALLMQYKALVLLSAFTSSVAYILVEISMPASSGMLDTRLPWFNLMSKAFLCARFCITFSYWFGDN